MSHSASSASGSTANCDNTNAANINFIAFGLRLHDLAGQVFSVFTIAVAAGEVAVGLAVVLALYRNRDTVYVDQVHIMKG